MKPKIIIPLSIILIISFIIFIIFNNSGLLFLKNNNNTNIITSNSRTNDKFEEIKVAFIGDQGYGDNAVAVLNLIKNEGTDFVLHQGDFEYRDDPDAWNNQINSTLGETFPYFASVGNHDLKAWDGYQQKLIERINKISGVECQGDIGVKSSCEYMGIFFILSGIGTLDTDHETYIQNELNESDAKWKICSWHKNQTLMQLGNKGNEIGWAAYDICRESGAIIATGHEHSYSRTYLMDNFAKQEITNTSDTLQISPGQTFAFVSGIAGHSIRDIDNYSDQNPWWASTYTLENNANYGVLFCTFNYQKNADQAYCYFKDINDKIIDEFYLINN